MINGQMMDAQNEAFLKRLLETFAQEAKEHVDNLSDGLLNLKKSSENDAIKAISEALFREAHSFKGASRSVNISEIEELCKAMEDVFGRYKQSGEKIPDSLIEVMLDANDMLNLLSTADEDKRRELKPKVQEHIQTLYAELDRGGSVAQKVSPAVKIEIVEAPEIVQEKNKEPQKVEKVEKIEEIEEVEKPEADLSSAPIEKIKVQETIRIPVKKLSAIMHQTEEMLFAKMVSKHHVDELLNIAEEIGDLSKDLQNQKPDTQEILIKLTAIESFINRSIKRSKGDAREIDLMVDRLIDDMKEALMLPFSTIFSTLPKVVHDIAKSVGKDVSLNVIGGEMEIDRRILEEMHDPLIHIVRNSIDHGIKSSGTITLTLTQKNASKVELSVRDDGSGIDIEKIRQSAIKNGIVNQKSLDDMDRESILNLIFLSGVSAAKIVTDLSGRGLGLAIVLEKTQQLGGQVHVQNNKEGGCEFKMLLPLTMATFRGIVTSIGKYKFIFASEHIARVMVIRRESIKNIEGKETVVVNQKVVPFYYLGNILELNSFENDSANISVVVVYLDKEMLAIGVDEIEHEEEVMVKTLGKLLARVKNIAGVSLLASDVPALILNISDIFKSVGVVSLKVAEPKKEPLKQKPKILVVDDSPTTRALLQNIMEMVGYDVVAAVDGMEAYEILKKESFDLVVSDVDMPRMNGFELTEAIRSNTRISELPVILVTALESKEDKEREGCIPVLMHT